MKIQDTRLEAREAEWAGKRCERIPNTEVNFKTKTVILCYL